ncbi:MAG: sulfatase [Candidatus Poribacteria bacterium]|nr:sulfatase [Candidatus Poribacteria bacterium]
MNQTPYRNILFLIADDWSRIAGCYGNDVIRTPNIDALAERSVVFDYAFCTSPSCAVSRACILTGLHSHTHGQYGHCHGIHGFRTHEFVQSIPKILKARGFATTCIGKKHVEPPRVYPFDFEPKVDMRSPTDMEDNVRMFLDGHKDNPFYLHVGSGYPHRAGVGFGNERQHAGVDAVHYDSAEVIVPDFLPDVPAVREDLADYYQSISRWDQVVGAVLEALDASGRADETLVFVTTDHAMPFPGAKASSFDSGHHCPLIIYSPDQHKRGIRNQALMSWVDFCPTILQWCNVAHPDGSEALAGHSLLPILEDETATPGNGDWEETYFSHCFHEVTNYYPYRVLRGRRYKYVRNLAYQLETPLPSDLFRSMTWAAVRRDNIDMLGQRPRQDFLHQSYEALFDMQNDPTESKNRIHDPALANVVADMRRKLMDFRIRTKDPWLEQSYQEGEPGAAPPGR